MAATTKEPPLPSEDADQAQGSAQGAQDQNQSQHQHQHQHPHQGQNDLINSTPASTDILDVLAVHQEESAVHDASNAKDHIQHMHSSTSLQTHRLNHTPSKLPSFRFADRDSLAALGSKVSHNNKQPQPGPPTTVVHHPHPSLPVSPHTGPGPAGIDSTLSSVGTAHHSAQNTSAIPENSTAGTVHTTSAPPTPAPPPRRLLPPSLLSPVTETNDPHPASTKHHDTSDDSPRSVSSPFEESPRSRASTNRTVSTSAPITPPTTTTNKRSASFHGDGPTSTPPEPAHSQTDADSTSFWTPASRPRTRRASSSRASSLVRSPIAARTGKESQSPGSATNNDQQQAPNLSPNTTYSSPPDENGRLQRRQSSASRPLLSYRPGVGAPAPGRPSIPPIRSFRSSESRKSTQIDMNGSSLPSYEDGDDYHDPQARDRSLRALEGRTSNDWQREGDADDEVIESENNTADIFMNIAREDSSSSLPRRRADGGGEDGRSSVVSRIARGPRQRPFSTIYTSFTPQAASSPAMPRRLSDQQVATPHIRKRTGEGLSDSSSSRDLTYHSVVTEKPTLKLDATRARASVSALKPSPITPRTQSVLDNSDRSSIFARRPPTNEHSRSRSTSIRQPAGLSKSFNSSPLVRNNPELQQPATGRPEASESSNSTAAPSTVWDELDELKSRIHRLELTGKMPKTSGAAMSRASDERPPTAGTGATTISGSPKRASGVGTAPTEVQSTASSQQGQPLLRSALSKTKPFLSSDVFDAIEAAAADALSLAQLMGTVGQPGPISSGASTIGAGGTSTVTDRQLRKKADSICRNLTELCLALTEEANQRNNASRSQPQTRGTSRQREEEPPNSPGPPTMRVFTGVAQQRQLARPDEVLPSIEGATSPRAMRLEKRATFNFTGVAGPSVPTPRYAPSNVGEDTGRKSSLIVARSRRGVTEEPDDVGRRTSLLRTRRAGTDEPADDSRKSSLVLTPRRVTTIGRVSNIDEEPQVASRAASRAIGDIGGGLRIAVPPRNEMTQRQQAQEPASASSILPRRRLIATNLPTPGSYTSRLATPTTPSSRRFLQVGRGQEDRDNTNNVTERLAEERGQRYSIGGPTAAGVGRTTSLHQKRNSGIASFSGTASNVGSYR